MKRSADTAELTDSGVVKIPKTATDSGVRRTTLPWELRALPPSFAEFQMNQVARKEKRIEETTQRGSFQFALQTILRTIFLVEENECIDKRLIPLLYTCSCTCESLHLFCDLLKQSMNALLCKNPSVYPIPAYIRGDILSKALASLFSRVRARCMWCYRRYVVGMNPIDDKDAGSLFKKLHVERRFFCERCIVFHL